MCLYETIYETVYGLLHEKMGRFDLEYNLKSHYVCQAIARTLNAHLALLLPLKG